MPLGPVRFAFPMHHLVAAAGIAALLASSPTPVTAQSGQTFSACYVASVGALYMIRQPGLPQGCVSTGHTEITWREGAAGPAGGDLAGNLPNPTVAGLRGRPLSTAGPAPGQVLAWTGTAWEPVTLPTSQNATPGGDLSGSISAATVIGIQGRPVSPSAPSPGQTLTWNGTAWIATSPGPLAISESSQDRSVGPQALVSVTVSCPAGRTAMSAGWNSSDPALALTQSRRETDGSGWTFVWTNTSATVTANARSTVYCGG